MSEQLNPALKEIFASQFGKVPELFPKRDDYPRFKLSAFDPDVGTARFVDGSGVSVDYVLLDPKSKAVARRELHRFGGNLLSAEASFRKGKVNTKYKISYDTKKVGPGYASVDIDYAPKNNSGESVSLAHSFYAQDKPYSIYIAFGTPEELSKYYKEERERSKRSLVFNCFPSSPGVNFDLEDPSRVVLKDGSFFGRQLAGITPGKTIKPQATEPYFYELSQSEAQTQIDRACGSCGEVWTFTFPDIDIAKLDKQIQGKQKEWTTVFETTPVKFAIKPGIKPCPSDEPQNKDPLPPPSLGVFG